MKALKSRFACIFFILVVSFLNTPSQTVNSILNINPFPSPYMSDWEINPASLGSMTIINNSSGVMEIKLRVNLSGKGKGLIFKGTSQVIRVNAKIPALIDNTVITDFDESQFPNKEFKNKVVQTGRLPEGIYSVCIDILDSRNLVLQSNLCANFTIVYPQPPQLIYPQNNVALLNTNNYPVFQWLPVNVPLNYSISYSLKIVEIISGQNPYQAFSANVPHFLEDRITTSTFAYPIYAQPLIAGKTYAWQVQALDNFGLPPTQNNGQSEIFTFTVNSVSILPEFKVIPNLISPVDTISTKTPKFQWSYNTDDENDYEFQLLVVKKEIGQSISAAFENNSPILYKRVALTKNSYQNLFAIPLVNNSNYVWKVSVVDKSDNSILATSIPKTFYYSGLTSQTFPPPVFSNSGVTGKLNYIFPEEGFGQPLGYTNIKLVVRYVLKYSSNTGNIYYEDFNTPTGEIVLPASEANLFGNDNGKILGTAKTDGQGNFSFLFIASDSMGIVKENHTFATATGEFKYIYKGDVYRVARLYLETPYSNYYTNPDKNIILESGQTLTIGNLFAQVRAYKLRVNVKAHNQIENQALPKNAPISGMRVYLLRKARHFASPVIDGSPPKRTSTDTLPKLFNNYEIVGFDSTDHLGFVTFSRVVKNVGVNDKYYIYSESSPKSLYNYKNLFPLVYRFEYKSDDAIFNSEYKYITRSLDVHANPQYPYIKGIVKRSDTKQPLAGVQVSLKTSKMSFSSEASTITGSNGKFNFTNLTNQYSNGVATGPVRHIVIYKSGYRFRIIDVPANNSVLKPGDKWSNEIYLEPRAFVTGEVITEYGGGINAKVRIGDGPVVDATPTIMYNTNSGWQFGPAKFETPAVTSSQSQKIVITPTNNSFAAESTYVVISQLEQDLGTFKLYKKKHRLVINIREMIPGQYAFRWPLISGARVKIKLPSGDLEKISNAFGKVTFEFENDATSFQVEVTAPKTKYYETVHTTINNTISKDPKTYYIGMKKAGFISGTVYVNNTPIKNASVFINLGSAIPSIGTRSNADGTYLLPNVPLNKKLVVWASKNSSDSTLVGDSKHITVTESGLTGIDLFLSVYEGMDITKLLGFPIEITTMKFNGDDISISGRFVKYPSNEIFAVDTTSSPDLSFTDIDIVPSTKLTSMMYDKEVPVASPVKVPIQTNSNSLDFIVYENLAGKIKDNNVGVHLIDPGEGVGVIKGNVLIGPASFNTGGSLSQLNDMHLKIPGNTGSDKMLIPALGADGAIPDVLKDGFQIVNKDGNDLQYKLNNFNAIAETDSSSLYKDTLRLNTTIDADISNIGEISIDIGNVSVHHDKIDPLFGNISFSFPMDTWSVTGERWSFNHSDFIITQGSLNTGAFNVPIKKMQISPSDIVYSEFALESMNIGGIIPLRINTDLTLGYDNTISQWFMIGSDVSSSAASFGGLPGMAAKDSVYLEAISFYSKSKSVNLTPKTSQMPLTIYDVGIFTPDQISVVESKNYVELTTMTFEIPKIPTLSGHIQYFKENDQITFRLVPVNLKFNAKGINANFAFDADNFPIYLDEYGLRAKGTVSEAGKFSFNSWLFHTKDSTSIWVETPNTPYLSNKPAWQKLAIGQNVTFLDKITGSIKPESSNDWSNFWFAGDLIAPSGIKAGQNRMTFEVQGEIAATDQELGISNIDTKFGAMEWTYEIENSRLIGNMHFDKVLSGDAFISGDANCMVDNDGWYFVSGGVFQMKNPSYSGNACLLFGDHQINDDILKVVKSNSWLWLNKNQLPGGFPTRVNGFYFEGGFSMPVPIIPEFDFNFGLVSASLSHSLGSDIFMDMQFSGDGNKYGTGFAVYGKISAGLGGSIILACAGVSASITADMMMQGYYYSSGEWFVDGDVSVNLAGTTYAGWGICDSNCEGIDNPLGDGDSCDKETASGSVSLGVKTHYGTDDKYVKIYLK